MIPNTWQRKRKARDGGERMPEVKEILDYYWAETERVHRCRPHMLWGREGAITKRILKTGADVNVLKNHITQSVRSARKGEARLALVNILNSFQATGVQQTQPIPPAAPAVPFDEIVGYLNEKTGSSYKPTDPATMRMIEARWTEGYRLEDFCKVIDNMAAKWGLDPKMMNFLRPVTLFHGEKFGNYLGAVVTPVDRGLLSRDGYRSSLVIKSWAERKKREMEEDGGEEGEEEVYA